MPSSIDGINVIVDASELAPQSDAVLQEIRSSLQPDKVSLVPELALIAVVGEGMSHTVGISSRVFSSLSKEKVNVRVINQGASEVNIIVGVVPEDFQPAVKALYSEFVVSQRSEA